jgi:hypothetical protein
MGQDCGRRFQANYSPHFGVDLSRQIRYLSIALLDQIEI